MHKKQDSSVAIEAFLARGGKISRGWKPAAPDPHTMTPEEYQEWERSQSSSGVLDLGACLRKYRQSRK